MVPVITIKGAQKIDNQEPFKKERLKRVMP
jgi:hypothetical protein